MILYLGNLTNKYRNVFDYYEYLIHSNDSLVCKNSNLKVDYFSEEVINPKIVSSSLEKGYTGINRFSSIEESDGIFVLLLLCFVLLVYILRRGFSFFKEDVRSVFFIGQSNVSFSRNETLSEFWSSLLLLFQTAFLYSIAIYIFLFESDEGGVHNEHIFVAVMSFVCLILLFELFRFLFFKLIDYLFNLKSDILFFQKFYFRTQEILGIIVFIPVLLLIYFDYYHDVLFILLLSLFIISRLIIISKVFIVFLQKKVSLLYLIAYLCGVEIIPYILLYNGLAYLYNIDIVNLLYGFES